MGITGIEVAKEMFAIILMDDNFTSIAKGDLELLHNRTHTLSPTLAVPELVWANVIMDTLTYPRRVLAMWVHLIMDTFAALALAPMILSLTWRILERDMDFLLYLVLLRCFCTRKRRTGHHVFTKP